MTPVNLLKLIAEDPRERQFDQLEQLLHFLQTLKKRVPKDS
jgi:hypothetical protein